MTTLSASPALRAVLAAGLVLVLLAGALAGSYALTLHAITQRQQEWCAILILLDAARVPRHATPAQIAFAADVHQIRVRFGCP